MIYPTKHITLKDGREALLRAPRVEDAAALLDLLKTTSGETDFLLRYPEECTNTLEEEERWVRANLDAPLAMLIVCEVGGELAGSCVLTSSNRIKVRHRGTIGIALRQAFWNLGIGTAMFEEMARIGREMGLSQLELEFIEGNDRGRHLYEKMGFSVVAEKPNAIRLKDGTMLREFMMVKEL